ncbi:hypothetical protein [Streptomyces sp.]|uniref:hypothetical protein n=1 Tax=Streptomyces sp. TaxID=1931 RepID=UPI0025DCB9F3|nr:hypothetical protein [Streptomyces sp.]
MPAAGDFRPSSLGPGSGGPENGFTNRNTTFMTWNLLHPARTLKDLMVRAGQSPERAQLIYQHSTAKPRRRLAQGIDAEVRAQLREATADQRNAHDA